MTPKELRAAVGRVGLYVQGAITYDEMGHDSIKAVYDHILATVRDDDDEAVTVEWCELCGLQCGRLYQGREWIPEFIANHRYVRMKTRATRGDVRKLCLALGIELKEPKQ